MPKTITRFALIFASLIAGACTQPAARVENKDSGNFSRGGTNVASRSYAPVQNNSGYQPYKPAPVYTNTQFVNAPTDQTAKVDSIGVTDLAPPPKTSGTSSAQKKIEPAVKPVNPWTNKPRAEAVEAAPALVAEEKPKEVLAKPEPILSEAKPAPVKAKEEVVARVEPTPVVLSKHGQELMWPLESKKVISAFGPKGSGKANDGINIASSEGEPVWAAADGEVVYVGNDLKGYGNMVIMKHSGGKSTSYAHLSRAMVDKYERVKQGDVIGYVGSTGNVKKSQLYFSLRDGKDAVDPQKYVSSEVAGL